MNKDIGYLIGTLSHVRKEDVDGMVNYTLTKILDGVYGSGGYEVYNRLMGVLECVKHEYYRRKISDYEDEKIAENGDIY